MCELRRATRRRLFDPAAELVAPGPRPVLTHRLPLEPLDHGLRVDLLVQFLSYAAQPGPLHLVLIRPGSAVLTGTDLAWYAAWSAASRSTGRTVAAAAAVTRYGFVDVVTGHATRTEPRRHRR